MSNPIMPQAAPAGNTAFAVPPATAAMYQQQYANSDAGKVAAQQPATPPVPQPSVTPSANDNQIIVPPTRVTNHILPPPNNAVQANTQPQVAQSPSTTEQTEATTTPVPPVSAPLNMDAALQRQLEMERQAWAREKAEYQAAIQQQQQALQQAANLQQEYNILKQQDELNKKLAGDEAFNGLTSVDADDARQIVQLTAQSLQAPFDAMKNELAKQQQQLAQQQQYINSQVGMLTRQRATAELQAAHPDFQQLVYDPKFIQFTQQRDGFTSRTKEQAAWEEFNRGNAEYLINMINEYKGQAPKVSVLQTAPPVQVANSAVNPAPPAPATPRYTLAELNNMMQMRQITPDQYRVLLNELRQTQQPVMQ